MEETSDEVYDYPRYYDIAFGWDPSKEVNFLEACFKQHAHTPIEKILELGCGTGRLVLQFARRGYTVYGLDKNPHMIEYLISKSQSLGLRSVHTISSNMTNFELDSPIDGAYCAINTFRYLLTEQEAKQHLTRVGHALKSDGNYVIDFNLVGSLDSYPRMDIERYPRSSREEWSMSEGNVTVKTVHETLGRPDMDKRLINERLVLEVNDNGILQKIREEGPMRTYTIEQFEKLVHSSGFFNIEKWYGPDFNIHKPMVPDENTERVLVLLRRH